MTVIEKSPDFAEIKLQYVRKRKQLTTESIREPEEAYRLLRKIWNHKTIDLREEMVVVLLNTSKHCIGWCRISIGGKTATIAELAHIAGLAILGNAHSVLLAHNHPSGNPNPSHADIILTKRIMNALHLHGIQLVDHLILYNLGYTSIRSKIDLVPDLGHLS